MLAESNGNLFAIACKSETERQLHTAFAIVRLAITLERERTIKKEATIDTKKEAKRIKSDNLTRSNIGKMNDWMKP